jgi:hypothetical protein
MQTPPAQLAATPRKTADRYPVSSYFCGALITNLLPVFMKFDGETLRSDARFSLRIQDDGTFAPAIHLIRNKPDLESPHFGVRLTEEDKQNLLKTGNLGRISA